MDDLGGQLTALIDGTEPIGLDELEVLIASTTPGRRRLRRPVVAVAAVIVAVAAVVAFQILVGGDRQDSSGLDTVGPAPSFGPPGLPGDCGGELLTDGVRIDDPLAGELCLGVDPHISTADQFVVRLVSVAGQTGSRLTVPFELGRVVVSATCAPVGGGPGERTPGPLNPGDETAPWLLYGQAPGGAASVDISGANGSTYSARTVGIAGLDNVRFYVLDIPDGPAVAAFAYSGRPHFLDVAGNPIAVEPASCDSGPMPSVEESEATMARLIAAQSVATGVEVGRPCPTSSVDPMAAGLELEVLTGGVDGKCLVVGWRPMDAIPGVRYGYYGQDGTMLWDTASRAPAPDAAALLDAAGGS